MRTRSGGPVRPLLQGLVRGLAMTAAPSRAESTSQARVHRLNRCVIACDRDRASPAMTHQRLAEV